MTRINVLAPSLLTRKHLVAEYREVPRVFTGVRKAQARGLHPRDLDIPSEYTLGTGHVLFFYDKLYYVGMRYLNLVAEMRARGYHVSFPVPNIAGIDAEWFGKYVPTPEAVQINIRRLNERGNDGHFYEARGT